MVGRTFQNLKTKGITEKMHVWWEPGRNHWSTPESWELSCLITGETGEFRCAWASIQHPHNLHCSKWFLSSTSLLMFLCKISYGCRIQLQSISTSNLSNTKYLLMQYSIFGESLRMSSRFNIFENINYSTLKQFL